MSQTAIPTQLRAFGRTADFTESTMPPELRRMHETRIGVWGKISVLEGKLLLRLVETGEKHMLTPDRPAVVCPRQAHELEPFGAVRLSTAG